jgi:hypothetical protein
LAGRAFPVRGENRCELLGGFGDAARLREQLANILELAAEGQRRATAESWNIDADPGHLQAHALGRRLHR